ncbi:hypothetical protein [Halobacillus mangrovi]|uniref:hypothetical protein n=1 Tax=Halobacillus mangrovi TaxID=402384 RepID=UPI003D990139
MGDLLDLIFSNFLIVAAIIGGLISWFSGMTKDEDRKQRPMGSPRSGPLSEPSSEPQRPAQGTTSQTTTERMDTKSSKDRLKDYYEEKQRRLDEVSDHRQKQEDAQHNFTYETPKKDVHSLMQRTTNSEKQNKQISMDGWGESRKWDKKRLAEGIVMAEILGRPRAHKPHSSHPRKR